MACPYQALGDDDGGGGPHQISQQGGQTDGDGDVEDLFYKVPPGDALPGVPLSHGPVEKKGQGDGGEDLAQDHAADDHSHRALRTLGQKPP